MMSSRVELVLKVLLLYLILSGFGGRGHFSTREVANMRHCGIEEISRVLIALSPWAALCSYK